MFEGDTVPEKADARFSLLAVGPDMKPVSAPVRWVLNRIDTDYQWYSVGGQWNWEAVTTRARISEGVRASANPAEIAPVEWGQYELLAEPTSGQGGQSSVQFYAGWGAVATSGTETPDRLQVVLDKPAYRSGDTARVKVQALADGLGLVSVLSNKLVEMKTVALKAGANDIDLPVTDDWGLCDRQRHPPAGRDARRPPPGGRMGLACRRRSRRPQAGCQHRGAPQETRPRGVIPVTLKVEGAGGETVHATVAAVDQGILNLTGYTPPRPGRALLCQRRLGVGCAIFTGG